MVTTLPTPCARDGKGPGHQHGLPDLIQNRGLPPGPPALLPTPTASPYGSNRSMSAGAAVRPSLAGLVVRQLLPTPTVADARSSANATARRRTPLTGHTGRTLTDFVRLLPTPPLPDTAASAAPPADGASPHPDRYDASAGSRPEALLPTPRTSDGRGPAGHGAGGPDLRTVVWLLPTPKASDGVKGCPAQRGSKGDLTLPSAAVRLTGAPCAVSGPRRGSGRDWGPYADAVARWEGLLGRPAPAPTQPGRHGRPVLAPPFVEWLMGLPAGFVTDLPLPRTLALKVLGNGCVPHQAATALVLLLCPHRWAVTP